MRREGRRSGSAGKLTATVQGERPKILVIRRDNIGDLVCTTPLIAALRKCHPRAFIAALVNTYNRDVLAGNPHLDAVYAYGKAKHRSGRESWLATYAQRVRLVLELRRERFDFAILAGARFLPRALRFARLAGAAHVVGFTEGNNRAEQAIDMPVPYGDPAGWHEVEDVFRLLAPLGVEGAPPALQLMPDPRLALAMQADVAARLPGDGPLVGIHISARRLKQRWPVERFAGLMRRLHERHAARFLILWAPGGERDARHPGDDSKASTLAAMTSGLPVIAVPTIRLAELIAALSACYFVICPDGGAMHLVAALGKPIVCLFGDSDPSRWRPWGVPYRLLQPASRDVRDISIDEVSQAFAALLAEIRINLPGTAAGPS